MEDVFQTIDHITSSEEQNKAFFNPNLEASKLGIQVNEVSYGKTTWQYKSDHPNNGQPYPVHGFIILSGKTISSQGLHSGKAQDIKAYKHGP